MRFELRYSARLLGQAMVSFTILYISCVRFLAPIGPHANLGKSCKVCILHHPIPKSELSSNKRNAEPTVGKIAAPSTPSSPQTNIQHSPPRLLGSSVQGQNSLAGYYRSLVI
ncbi:hypothetical protein TcWFU_006791 [Taenia crassiceps]|uniref:Uncharacterized protein n=1 Tax=Taenia crassiceps TaxID=6207 RepID=A0ABR4QEE8_9CEST